jgi:glc operon protein GlcG
MLELCLAGFKGAEQHNSHVALVAVDLSGHPVVVLRADRAPYPAVEAARRKAVAAASLRMPTAGLSEMFATDPLVLTAIAASGEMLIVPGGFPIMFDNECVGGFGVAGGHYNEDDAIGRRALAASASASESKPVSNS